MSQDPSLSSLGRFLWAQEGGKLSRDQQEASIWKAKNILTTGAHGLNAIQNYAPQQIALSSLEHDRKRAAWRIARYVLMACGACEANEPLSMAVTNDRLDQPFDPYRPIKVQKFALPTATSLPGIRRFQDYFAKGSGPSLLYPPPQIVYQGQQSETPIGCPSRATAEAWEFAADGFRMDETEKGTLGLIPGRAPFGSTLESLTLAWEYCPTIDEILEFEQDFLTTAADVLAEGTEDSLRRYLKGTLCGTEWEAYSITQTVKYWAVAIRPITPDVERVLMVRSLENSRLRAEQSGDLASSISANRLLASILGLTTTIPGATKDQQLRSFDDFARSQREALRQIEPSEPLPNPEAPKSIADTEFEMVD